MEKARTKHLVAAPVYFVPGSLSDPALLICPASPKTPFEFPFPSTHETPLPLLMDEFDCLCIPLEGVQWVVGLPWVFGLHGDNSMYTRFNRLATATNTFNASAHPPMMDGNANICVMGILGLLVDVSTIPPLLILVATKSNQLSLNDCCTKCGYLPLTLDDGSVYYQICYYCANALETIISLDAILQSSDILTHRQQEGHRDGSPGTIHLTSNSGLYSITLTLEKCDGLYYCPTNLFTVAPDPTCPAIPQIKRVAAPTPPTPSNAKRGRRYLPISQSKLAESETWMLWLGLPGENQLDLLPGNVTGIPHGFYYHPFHFLDWKGRHGFKSRRHNNLVHG